MNKQLIGILIFTLLANLFAEHPTGVRQLSEQERERILQDAVEYEPPLTRAELPPRVVNQAHLPRVWSQGQLGICGSFAPTYYVRNYYESKRLGEGRWDFEKDMDKMVSPTWSVIMVDHGQISVPDGASPLETIQILCKYGFLTLSELPFTGDFQDWYAPSATEQLTALRHKGGKAVCLSNITQPEGLLKLKKALAAGEIFVAHTSRIPPNFDNYPSGGVDEKVTLEDGKTITVNSNNNSVFAWPSAIEAGSTRDSHAVTIIGYDDNMAYTAKDGTQKKGALLAVNSWGEDWGVSVNGEGGYIWFSYDSIMTHNFLSGEVYTTTVGDGNYVPSMTATLTFSCDGYSNGWKQIMVGNYGRNWPGGFDFTINGLEMDNPFWGISLYVKGQMAAPTQAEVLIDLSGFEHTCLWQFDAYIGFASNKSALGKFVQADFRDVNGNITRTVPIDMIIQPYSNIYPAFKCSLPNLYETQGVLPPLYPHGGSIQFGDLNGDGLIDAVSSVRQNNGVEEGIVNDEGYRMYVENRHSVWLRQADGSWQESLLPISDSHADVILVDLTDDGVLDIAASNGENTYFFKNDGQGNFTTLAVIEHRHEEYAASGSTGFFATADFDNDGRPDFVLVNDVQTQVIRQESSTKYTIYPVSDRMFRGILPVPFAQSIAVGDINGDGWTDFVAVCETPVNFDSSSVLFINNGNLRFTPYELPLPRNASFTSIAIADADQDGYDDILCCSGPYYDQYISGRKTDIRILHGRPNDAQGNVQLPVPLPIASDIPSRWGGNVAWADVDMDGRLEAVMSGCQGTQASNGSDPYGNNWLQDYPLLDNGWNYLKILSWDGGKYVDSHLSLPGTSALTGPALMAVVDFDGDGKPDIVHGGLFYGRSEVITGKQGPDRTVTGMRYVHNEVNATNDAPSAPTELFAKDAKNGKATFTWNDGTDAETSADGLRYFLRVGTASGKDDVIASGNGFARRSNITLTNLPAKKLYWAVRTIDATGNLSPWSVEATVTPTGTTPKPSVPTLNSLPEIIAVPEIDFDSVNDSCKSANESQGTAYGAFAGYYNVGEPIELRASPKPGYRFAYWEGAALEPLSRVSKAYYYNNNEQFIAHFMPDFSYLQASENATGYRDDSGNLWLWGTYNNINGQVVQDTPPQFAAASGLLYFALVNETAYFGKKGANWYFWENVPSHHWADNYGYNRLLRAVDGSIWDGGTSLDDKENVEHAWGGPGGLAAIRSGKNARSLAVTNGAETYHDNINLTDGEDVIDCAVQSGFVLILTSIGTVKGIGDNERCQLGSSAPLVITQYTEIKGLPLITSIAAGATFGAALDWEGNVWTWGDNRKGQLGRGTVGATYSMPAKIAGLAAKIIAITAGDNHLVALDENGALHAWGDNTKGQLGAANGLPLAGKKVTAVSAAANRTVAITENGDLYAWGDGDATPRILDNVHFTPVSFTLDIDDRYANLLPMGSGDYAARTGVEMTITAQSNDESTFQYWTVNGEIVEGNPLVITPTGSITVKAFFASRPAVLTLGEPTIGDTDITIPVMMSDSQNTYDGLDFTLEFSSDLKFNELNFTYPIPSYMPQFDMAGDSDGMTAIRFQAYGGYDSEKLFNQDKEETNVELFKLVFVKPTTTMDVLVKLVDTPLLSRDYGRYAETAALGDPAIRMIHIEGKDNGSEDDKKYKSLDLSNLQAASWNAFSLPGDIGVTTVEDLRYALGVSNLVAWTWDGSKYRQAEEISPFQPLLLYFTGQPYETLPYIECDAPTISLKPGWNMVVVPQETAPPDGALAVFRLDKATQAYIFHEGVLLPNELHWIFKKNK